MNSVILSGFMWQKKFFDGGTPRLNFNLGLNVGKDKEGKPIWENISCVVWGERARSMEKYFNDGDACEVQAAHAAPLTLWPPRQRERMRIGAFPFAAPSPARAFA